MKFSSKLLAMLTIIFTTTFLLSAPMVSNANQVKQSKKMQCKKYCKSNCKKKHCKKHCHKRCMKNHHKKRTVKNQPMKKMNHK